jgi:hypothetical protein
MRRWLGSLAIVALLAFNWAMPSTKMGRRGVDSEPRADIESATLRVGAPMPNLEFMTIDGTRLRIADFRGKRVLITFERSVDW